MKTQGTIKEISNVLQPNPESTFKKIEFILSTDEDSAYPQTVQFCATNDRINLLSGLKVGDFVSVDFSLRGKEYIKENGDKVNINTLDVFRITKI